MMQSKLLITSLLVGMLVAPVIAADISPEQRAIGGAQLLKKSMKDPDSFELKELDLMPDGTACYTFRARNAYNAALQSSAVLTPGKGGTLLVEEAHGNRFVKAWNSLCAKKRGENLTRTAKRFL